MKILVLILAIIAWLYHFSYQIICIKLFGITSSISRTFYEWIKYGKEKLKYLGTYFQSYFSVLAFLTGIVGVFLAPTILMQIYAVLASFGLIIVGSVPEYEKDKYSTWHYIGAGISAVFAGLYCFGFGFGWCYLLSILFGLIIQKITIKSDRLYWAEHGCIYYYLSLLIYLSIIL